MCIPDNLRDNCSCPHLVMSRLRTAAKAAAVAGAAGGVWWVLAAGYWWVLAGVVWVALMAAGWRLSRREWVLVHRYTPQRLAVDNDSPHVGRSMWSDGKSAAVVWTDRDRLPRLQVQEHPGQPEAVGEEHGVDGEQAEPGREPQHRVPGGRSGWPHGGHQFGRRGGDDGVGFKHNGNHS